MYVIRRHSRKLFFPAGLLALAWLPVLGGALLAARPELRPPQKRVVPLYMPPIQRYFTNYDGRRISLALEECYASAAQLATLRPWYTVRFTGNPWEDDLSARLASFVAQQLRNNPTPDRGLRIQFGPHSQYRSLVAMLSMFQKLELKKYWFDIRHQPSSLLASTEVPLPPPSSKPDSLLPTFICGGVIELPEPPPVPLHVDLLTLVDAYNWQPLLASDWRYATLLLLLLPLAAVWQLRRLRTTDFRR